MAQMNPRDIYAASVLGGGLIGLALMVLGVWLFGDAFNASSPGATSMFPYLFEGATFFIVGGAFAIVSVIYLPARRALQLESTSHV